MQSMTGFGTASFEVGGQGYQVEIKSVNHRSFSSRCRLPSELNRTEVAVNKRLRSRLGRGSVDLFVQRDKTQAPPPEITVDHKGLKELMTVFQSIAEELNTPSPTLEGVLRHGDFIRVETPKVDAEAVQEAWMTGLDAAIDELLAMRNREGKALAVDLQERIANLRTHLSSIENAAPVVYQAYEARLKQRLAEAEKTAGVALDPGRLATELVMFSDRSDLTEEVVRARSHLDRFEEAMTSGHEQGCGKRLEFLSQELLREFNTMGSKCRDAGIADAVVDAKVELERVREQVHNIA